MTDETQNEGAPATGNQQGTGPDHPAPTAGHHHHVVGVDHTIRESGEGSLLGQTVEMVERRNRSQLVPIEDVANVIEVPLTELSPSGGFEVIDQSEFDSYRAKPLYRSGTAQLGSVASLIDYTNRYKGTGTVLFADDDRAAPSITSVFDYHEQGGPEDGGQRFGRHRATHALPLSDEWKAWKSLDGKQITMPNFARFLEDHIVDVLGAGEINLSPTQQSFVDALGGVGTIADPAKLMELATGLRVFENSQASQAVNLSSGEAEIVFSATHTDGQGGKLIVPKLFVIAIPVFQHGDPYQIVTRLRYRREGGITFIYELWRDDLVFDHAFEEAAGKAASGTSVPLFLGKPENA